MSERICYGGYSSVENKKPPTQGGRRVFRSGYLSEIEFATKVKKPNSEITLRRATAVLNVILYIGIQKSKMP